MVAYTRIISEAKKLKNIPFCHRGVSVLGVDCIGIIRLTYNRAGIPLPTPNNNMYKPRWWQNDNKREELLTGLIEEWDFEIVDKPYPGGLITFRLFMKNGPINHCGIILDAANMLHARCGRRIKNNLTRIEDLEMYPKYNKRIAYYLKHRQVDYG